MTVEVQHTVREGMETEALQVIKEIYNRGLNYPGGSTEKKGLLVDDATPGLEAIDGYRDHLGKLFSQIRQVADDQARIKVRLIS
jgi:hypothetical protein